MDIEIIIKFYCNAPNSQHVSSGIILDRPQNVTKLVKFVNKFEAGL